MRYVCHNLVSEVALVHSVITAHAHIFYGPRTFTLISSINSLPLISLLTPTSLNMALNFKNQKKTKQNHFHSILYAFSSKTPASHPLPSNYETENRDF